jgi:hypothetical protein
MQFDRVTKIRPEAPLDGEFRPELNVCADEEVRDIREFGIEIGRREPVLFGLKFATEIGGSTI